MKEKELMIGDWVRTKGHTRPREIKDHFDLCNAHLYDPLSITPEILEKNGFEYDEEGRVLDDNLVFWIDDIRYVEYNPTNRAFLILGESSTFDGICIYVHELQHALRLCGIDKEIEL